MKPDAEQPFIRILLVEDDEDDFILTRDALRSISKGRMVLEWVDNGEQALEELRSGRHDVCLLDYRLDASTGLELLARMRQQGWLGPVILLTGMSDEALDEDALKAGAADFLDKSQLTPTLLARSIRYALQHARTLEELRRSRASFRALIERLPDGVGVTQDERLVYANPALVSLIAFRPRRSSWAARGPSWRGCSSTPSRVRCSPAINRRGERRRPPPWRSACCARTGLPSSWSSRMPPACSMASPASSGS